MRLRLLETVREQNDEIAKYQESLSNYRERTKSVLDAEATLMASRNGKSQLGQTWLFGTQTLQDPTKQFVGEELATTTDVQALEKENEYLRNELTDCQCVVESLWKALCNKDRSMAEEKEAVQRRQINTSEMMNLIDQMMGKYLNLVHSSEERLNDAKEAVTKAGERARVAEKKLVAAEKELLDAKLGTTPRKLCKNKKTQYDLYRGMVLPAISEASEEAMGRQCS